MEVRVTAQAFDPGSESNAFLARHDGAGAAVTFTGIVRSKPDDPIVALTLECYVELAEGQIAALVGEAVTQFSLIDAAVIHRYGRMLPGEPIMQVMTLAPHREDAFRGAQFLMDYLKTEAPFWKREETSAGARWVEARAEDDVARGRWKEGHDG